MSNNLYFKILFCILVAWIVGISYPMKAEVQTVSMLSYSVRHKICTIMEWKIIKKFPKYKINRDGVIINIRTNKILKPQFSKVRGYVIAQLYNNSNIQKRRFLHKLMAEAFIPNPQNKPFINHKDGNKLNNTLDNFEWCTAYENYKHALEYGLLHPNWVNRYKLENRAQKLGVEKVINIKKMLIAGEKGKDIAKFYNVHPTMISRIKLRKAWMEVEI